MSKVLKVVAIVASVAAAAVTLGASLGISAALLSAVSLGAGLGASLLAPRPKTPANSRENIDRLRANVDPRTPRKTAVGVTALATDIRDEEFTGDQEFFHRFIVCASHKVKEVTEVWFDDKIAWTLAGGVQGEFVGYLTVAPVLEGSAANAINISSRMGTTRRYTGMAYVHLRYKLTGNDKKADSPFAQSITTRITIRGKAAALPDPREPSHDMADQSTWAWDEDAARNPALQLLFYLLGYRINGLIAVGKGIPPARIDLNSFITAANICDETVATEAGGTEPRYRSDGVWSEGDNPTSVIDMLKASMNADLDDVNGQLRLTVFHNDLATPVAFNDDDIIGAFEWEDAPPLDQTSNIIRGVFTDPSDESLYQPIDYPQIEEASPDGIDRIDTFNLPMVQSPDQAQRLAALRLARQTYGSGTFRAELQATAWAVQKNSVISLTFKARGWTGKLFRVAEMDLRTDGVVPLVLREEDARIYNVPTLAKAVDPVATTPYDPSKDPIRQAIAGGADMLVSRSVTYPLTSDETSITITAFTGVTRSGRTISFPSGSISGLASSGIFEVFWNGASYIAPLTPATANFANSELVYIGRQGTADSGGGYTPPDPPPGGSYD